jgi:hypothetical protein
MSAVKENLLMMIPDMPTMIPNLTEDKANQVYDIFITVKPEKTEVDREARAQRRMELIKAKKYVRSSGRTHEEIEADLREMRSDRF